MGWVLFSTGIAKTILNKMLGLSWPIEMFWFFQSLDSFVARIVIDKRKAWNIVPTRPFRIGIIVIAVLPWSVVVLVIKNSIDIFHHSDIYRYIIVQIAPAFI